MKIQCWEHGSVIRSWLLALMERTYREVGDLSKVPPYVEDTGEVNWLVGGALRTEVPIPVITQSVVQLVAPLLPSGGPQPCSAAPKPSGRFREPLTRETEENRQSEIDEQRKHRRVHPTKR